MSQLPEFTKKHPSLLQFMEHVTGKARTKGECVICDATNLAPDSFRDTLSIAEYAISGMCQKCQDEVFDAD